MGQVLASRGYSLDSLQLILSFRFLGILKYSQNIKTILFSRGTSELFFKDERLIMSCDMLALPVASFFSFNYVVE